MKDTKSTTEKSYDEKEALKFHSEGRPGKIEINATKPMATQRDLALAYSPGVAAPVLAISENPDSVYDYTAKGNLVAVISMSIESTSANLLNKTAFPSITGLDASAPKLPSPKIAVPLEITATILPREV